MNTEIVFNQEYQGYSIIVAKVTPGVADISYWYTGHVGIPKEHSLYGIPRVYVDKFKLHSKTVYSSNLKDRLDLPGWFISFSTDRWQELPKVWTLEATAIETLRLASQLIAMECTDNLSTWLNKLKLKLKLQQ